MQGAKTRTSGQANAMARRAQPEVHKDPLLEKVKAAEHQAEQTMLSQDSIKHYMEDAQKETENEERRLAENEKERKAYFQSLSKGGTAQAGGRDGRGKTGNVVEADGQAFADFGANKKKLFGKFVDGSDKKERLEDLLEKVESYTKFILQQNQLHRRSQQQKASGASKTTPLGSSARDGKQSISKRRLAKSRKGAEEPSEEASDDEEQATLTRLTVQPAILKGGQLRDYQLDGLNWMVSLYETGINGILADEMGLGKTIQTISFLSFLREFKNLSGPHLCIMPKSVVGNWMSEFRKWCPEIKVCNLIAKKESREEIIKTQLQPGKFDVCITTFEGVRICMTALSKFNWRYIIIDEAHKIKNEDSQISKRIRQLNSKNRLLLTGTPLQNNLHELWSLLNFLLPEIFSSSNDFDEWFDLGNKGGQEMTDQEKEEKNNEVIKQLHKILRPFMLRRIKRDVEKSLLPKIEMHINVGITETQKQIYRQLLKKSTIEKGTSVSHYKNVLIQLRKVCDHPYLFPGIEPDDAPELGDHLVKACGKMQFLDKLLKKSKEDNSQTLIFSGFTSMLDILEDYCRFKEYKYCRLDGNTDLDDRQAQIDDYTSPDTDKFIFLISTRAGGLGLNLMTANTVVLYDSDWNPQMDLQAMDRAHRIGQKKQVRVYRLITKNTMEEKMVEKQTMKLKLDSLIIQKGRMAPKQTGYQKDDLKDMVNYGADAIFEMGSDIDEDDIEDMIAKGEEQAKNLHDQAEEIMKDKFNMLNFEMNSCNLYEFEDVDYLKQKRKDQEDALKQNVIAMLDAETAEASRRKNKKNLAESNLCPNIYGNGNVGVSNEAKKKRLSKVTDFRFFPDPDRLRELIELEMEAKYQGYVQGVEQPIFTPEMKEEKEFIESQGFMNWDRKDYQKFINALELFARDDYENISKHLQGTKTPEEVQKYATVFFQKIRTLNESNKIMQRIQKAQSNVHFNLRAPHIIRNKVCRYNNPLEEMNLPYATQKSKFFSRESDIILICLTDKLGYGNWSDIKRALRRENRCRFDNLFISRSEDEIKKRIIYLVQSLDREQEEEKKTGKKEKVDPYENIQFAEMEAEINAIVNKNEEKLLKAYINVYAQPKAPTGGSSAQQKSTMDKSEQKQNSQSSLKTDTKFQDTEMKQDETIPLDSAMLRKEESHDIDNEVLSCDYDRVSEKANHVKKNGKGKAKKGKKRAPVRKNSDESMESGIRIGEENRSEDNDSFDDEGEVSIHPSEEDAIAARELGLDHEAPGTDNEKSKVKNGASTKSTKQSNLADWGVYSSTKKMTNGVLASESKNLVGQKRANGTATGCEVEEPEKKRTVSEFTVSK